MMSLAFSSPNAVLTKMSGKFPCILVSKELCLPIASMRRELMRHAKAKLLFLDETYLRIGTCLSRTFVAPGEEAHVVVDDTDAYAPRYDMIACCSGERVFPPIIFAPTERKKMDVKGIREWMLL